MGGDGGTMTVPTAAQPASLQEESSNAATTSRLEP
jgi:hypothetical protein